MYNIEDIYNVSNIYIRSDYITCKLLLALDYIRPVSVSSSFSYTFFHPLSSIFFGCTYFCFLCYFELFSFSYSRSAESVEINKHTNFFMILFFCCLFVVFIFSLFILYIYFFIQFVLFSVSYFLCFVFILLFFALFLFLLYFFMNGKIFIRDESRRERRKRKTRETRRRRHTPNTCYTQHLILYIYNIYIMGRRERERER